MSTQGAPCRSLQMGSLQGQRIFAPYGLCENAAGLAATGVTVATASRENPRSQKRRSHGADCLLPCSYCGGALRRPLLEDGYEPLQSADEPEGAEGGAAFVRELLFEVLFTEFVDIAADVTNVRGLLASALREQAGIPSLQSVRDARPAFLCLD